MNGMGLGFMARNDRKPARGEAPPRGERIAAWVESYMRANGMGVSEIAFLIGADKRDVRRLIADRSCGPRLNDLLEAAFAWDFIETVATPVVGADPITAREVELAQRLAEAAAVHARLERERAARAAAAGVAAVARTAPVPRLASRGRGRSFNPRAPESA